MEINKYPKNILIQVAFLEIYVINLLEKVIKKGDTYIISNSLQGWVEYCCKTFFPNVLPLLNNVKIVYSKINYMKKHPKCALMWKRECFNEITNTYNLDLPSNIISIGDSISELEAGRNLENKFTGWTDVGLSEKGVLEAKEAGKLLKEKGYSFDKALRPFLFAQIVLLS